MLELIDFLREEIKLSKNRSCDIRELSENLLKLALKLFDNPDYRKVTRDLWNCVKEYCQNYDELYDLAYDINDAESQDVEGYCSTLQQLDDENKLENIDDFSFEADKVKNVLFIKILLLAINKPICEDYRKDIVHEKIYDNLRNECSNHADLWRCSIYGSGYDDGTSLRDKYTEPHDPFSIEERKISEHLISMNYCGTSPRLTDFLCGNCKSNFIKVGYFLKKNRLHILADNWYSSYNRININTVKRVQSQDKFLERYPQCAKLVKVSHKRKNTNVIHKLDDYFDGDLTSNLDEIKQKDILNVGWYFNGDLSPLMECANLKGLVLGHWFSGNLDVLKTHPSLQFIRVQPSYNQKINKSVSKITFC